MEIQNLTDTKLNVMVAEAMGWTWSPAYNKRRKFNDLVGPPGMARVWKDGLVGGHGLPKFSTSLDACATFEATLSPTQLKGYATRLCMGYLGLTEHPMFEQDWYAPCLLATPRQRCIAFLRMKGVL